MIGKIINRINSYDNLSVRMLNFLPRQKVFKFEGNNQNPCPIAGTNRFRQEKSLRVVTLTPKVVVATVAAGYRDSK